MQLTWYESRLLAAPPVARRLSPRLRSWIVSTSASMSSGSSSPGACPALVRAHVQHADAVVRVQHGDGVRGRISSHRFRLRGVSRVQRVQHERRQGEVVDPVDLARDVDLFLVVPVDFDQHLHAKRARLRREFGDERERLGNHEAAGSGLLDRISDRMSDRMALMPAAWNRASTSPGIVSPRDD